MVLSTTKEYKKGQKASNFVLLSLRQLSSSIHSKHESNFSEIIVFKKCPKLNQYTCLDSQKPIIYVRHHIRHCSFSLKKVNHTIKACFLNLQERMAKNQLR